MEKEEFEKANEYILKEHNAYPNELEPFIFMMHLCFDKDDFKKANKILDKFFSTKPDEFILRAFNENMELNLKFVEYNDDFTLINERVKDYLNKNFN